ncbi:hypothetical protein I5H97_gp055 [Mycobacterium phage Wachhund]|uniref:Uncharacterized protein n=1 Tax=Mycobacterium phage Wachhund TaxID=2027903 RepID=A0A249XRS0_9CAUD|nr:hypothetical protein I5H97_gp055 [Mycobacterium phage Wachhund]ASZ74429.1 hypothetical protein SEA_WACHHUND_55 [Mycobacterium phage Wachhund]
MNLVERLNARFNNVIHDGLALVGAVVDPWLARLERQAMSNALGKDRYMTRERDQADFSGLVLMSVVAALDGSPWVTKGHLRELSSEVAAVAVERMSETDSFFLPDGTLFEKRDSDTAECELLAEDICDEAEEAELLDEFMELGEFLDSATAEELAAMRQQREVSEDDLTMRIADLHGWSVPSIVDSRIARALLETYHITPR